MTDNRTLVTLSKVHFFEATGNGTTAGKVADAELHFVGGLLDGLKLVGFAIWQRRSATGYNVTFPARSYSINGERRSFALLRPIADTAAQDTIRTFILAAWDAHEAARLAEAV